MLLDAIAAIILAGLMVVPIVNAVVGAFVGAAVAGPPGAGAGLLLAVLITAAEKWLSDRLGWGEIRGVVEDADGPAVVTGPPTGRRQSFARRPIGTLRPRVGALDQAARASGR